MLGGRLKIRNSSIYSNTSNNNGGGIYSTGNLMIANSTISGNSAPMGGGIYVFGGKVSISSSTIGLNRADSNGGIYIYYTAKSAIQNTILAGNQAGGHPDCSENLVSQGYNLIENVANCGISPSTGDLLGIKSSIFPGLAFIQLYPAGYLPITPYIPFWTHLYPNMPEVNKGNPAGCSDENGVLLGFDQRGVPRNGRCEIGAYEYDPAYDPLRYAFFPLLPR